MPEFTYILKRILLIIPTLVVILLVTFVLVRLLPGDPASAMLGKVRISHQTQKNAYVSD